jgi:hypothetical protein
MSGIFVSYRRDDTAGWAGRLFDELCRNFGKSQVFMDVEGGIPRGAKFEEVLNDKLSTCDALLALIGPRWLDCTRNGRRRLEMDDDWVRSEIAIALLRDIKVFPVLFGATSLPDPEKVPNDVRKLVERQYAEVTDDRWSYDVGELVKELATFIPRAERNDVKSVTSGIRFLQDLITEVPDVADAVSRSREVIENTHRQIKKLDVFKTVHDSLHTIEFECLRPMQEAGASRRLRPFKIRFAGVMQRIQDSVGFLSPVLQVDVMDELERAYDALQAAVDRPEDIACFDAAIGELTLLLSSLPVRLDEGMAQAAADLNLDRLVALMASVREQLPSGDDRDDELEPFVEGIDALGRLRDELRQQATEHSHLQRLDSKLRTVCVGAVGVTSLSSEWARIKRLRSRLERPYSSPLEAAGPDLTAIEEDIDDAVAHTDESSARDLVREYFRSVSSVFREVDQELRGFCQRLSEVNQGLETVLRMC